MTTYGAITTTHYKAREAARSAGGSQIVFTTFAVGDGNGVVPALSSAGVGLVHEVYRGAVSAVAVNPNNAAQIDITCLIPNAAGSFTIREMMVLDEAGAQVVAAITNIVKTSTNDGQVSDFQLVLSIAVGDAQAVTIVAPDSEYATRAYVQALVAGIQLQPGPQGNPGTTPTITGGTITTLAAGAAATAALRQTATGVYALDLGIPAGTNGTTPSITAGAVTALAAGAAPTIALRQTGSNAYALDIGLPAGAKGDTGSMPALTAGNVTTLAAGASATFAVRQTGAGTYALDLGLPRGAQGAAGAQGDAGPTIVATETVRGVGRIATTIETAAGVTAAGSLSPALVTPEGVAAALSAHTPVITYGSVKSYALASGMVSTNTLVVGSVQNPQLNSLYSGAALGLGSGTWRCMGSAFVWRSDTSSNSGNGDYYVLLFYREV